MAVENIPALPEESSRGLSRRQMIKAAGIAGAAAWTAPMIIDSITSPAGAFTAPPCPDKAGDYYAIVYSPGSNPTDLADRDPDGTGYGAVTIGSCPNVAIPSSGSGSACRPPAGYGHTFSSSIQLDVTGTNISHNITNQKNGENNKVTIKLNPGSCCKITGVKAFVHKFQLANTGFDCPDEYCQPAILSNGSTDANSTDMLRYVFVSDKEWHVWTNSNPALCSGGANGNNVGIHWGSPNNQDSSCVGYATGAKPVGQSFGYMLITLNCAPGFVQP